MNEKLHDLVDDYIEAHQGRPPTGIVMTERDYETLKARVNSQLRKELHYSPRFFHGIPIVTSRTEMETKCLPA